MSWHKKCTKSRREETNLVHAHTRSEVRELEVTSLIQQHVVRLHITVHKPHGMDSV